MAFSIETRSFSSVRTYADAEALFKRQHRALSARQIAKRAPWSDTVVPLVNPKKKHFRIEREGTTYRFVLYRTAVISYREDLTLEVDLTWDSVSTRSFFTALSPFCIGVEKKHGRTWLVVVNQANITRRSFCADRHPLVVDLRTGEVQGAEPVTIPCRRADGPARKLLRFKLKHYVDWVRAVCRACDSMEPAVAEENNVFFRSKENAPIWNFKDSVDYGDIEALLEGDTDVNRYRRVTAIVLARKWGTSPCQRVVFGDYDALVHIDQLDNVIEAFYQEVYRYKRAFIAVGRVIQPGENP